jgi:predicted lipoprotein with Yx(FWY)xxD motif
MKISLKVIGSLVFAMVLTACATAPDVQTPSSNFIKISNGILTSSYGKTVYTFDKDQAGSGKSECVSTCADNWPPVFVEPGIKVSGDFNFITRANGQRQLTYKGKPLYFYAKDTKTGDKLGDGVNSVWRVVSP